MLIFEYEGGWGYLARRKGVGGVLKTRSIYGLREMFWAKLLILLGYIVRDLWETKIFV